MDLGILGGIALLVVWGIAFFRVRTTRLGTSPAISRRFRDHRENRRPRDAG